MRIVVENGVDTTGLDALFHALCNCEAAEACCVGDIDKDSVYLRCPGAKHGVIFCRADNSETSIRWAIDTLKTSVALSERKA